MSDDDLQAFPHREQSRQHALLRYPPSVVWREIRDFNTYPNYIDGVTESVIEDERAGDEVGCIRRFVYRGETIRQTLTGHSDPARWFSHAGCEPLQWPASQSGQVGETVYENRIALAEDRDPDTTRIEWSMVYRTRRPADAVAWKRYFDEQIPQWIDSLRRYLDAIRASDGA